MNKKGFTLIELLAVIIILSLLVVLVSTSVTKLVTNSKKELSDRQIILIKKAAETWGADNIYKLPSEDNECKYLTLEDLQTYGVIDSNIIDPKNNKNISSDINIKISASENKYNNVVINYEVDSDVSTCDPIYLKICTLVNDADKSNSITEGDKYQCKVKNDMEEGFENGYYFHVISFNEDGSVNLIMERNICDDGTVATSDKKCLVAWYESSVSNSFGPITAMNYLYKATKDWENIPNIIMDYIDEGFIGSYGYGTIKTVHDLTQVTKKDGTVLKVMENEYGYTNLKARMPKYVEVHGNNKCLTAAENNGKFGSCPLWLANYLHNSSHVNGEGLQNLSGIYAYWTISSVIDHENHAWYIDYGGALNGNIVTNTAYHGVRPVITIPKYNLSNKVK